MRFPLASNRLEVHKIKSRAPVAGCAASEKIGAEDRY